MDALIAVVVFLVLVAIIAVVVRYEIIPEEEAGGHGAAPLPWKMQQIVGADRSDPAATSDDPAATDPSLPSFDAAYANPALLQAIGVDGIVFEKNAEKQYVSRGKGKGRRRVLIGTYSRVYVLDHEGSFRTLASVNCLDAIDVAVALEDQSRDLAERLGVQFQVL